MSGTPQPSEAPQATLIPPEAVEITLRVGLVGSDDHGQWQLEVRNATDGVLLSMIANPHFNTQLGDREFTKVATKLIAACNEYLLPF